MGVSGREQLSWGLRAHKHFVCKCGHMHATTHMDVKGQISGVSSLYLSCRYLPVHHIEAKSSFQILYAFKEPELPLTRRKYTNLVLGILYHTINAEDWLTAVRDYCLHPHCLPM